MSFRGDLFEPKNAFKIEEKKSDVDGQSVLAKVSGTFFVPGGVSRNNRYYPPELWEKVLGDDGIKSRLSDKRMIGTISHEQSLNDQALLDGKISHIITNLEVRGDQDGFGEALILDTPAGRILNTMFRAGAKLFVSSRANGTFKQDKTEKGVPIVDPETYQLEAFDFVLDPGFLQAQPQLAESLKQLEQLGNVDKPANDKEGDIEMKNLEKLLESVTVEKNQLQGDLDTAVKEVEKLKGDLAVQTDEANHLKDEIKKYEGIEEKIKAYEEIGTVEEINKAMEIAEKELDAYKELGTSEEVKEKMEKNDELIKKYEELGDTPEEIEEALDNTLKVVDAYTELGTPEEIGEAFDRMEAQKEKEKEKEVQEKIKGLAEEIGVSEEKIKKLWDKEMTEAEIKDLFADMKKSDNKDEDKEDDDKDKDENKDDKGDKTQSLSERFKKKFNEIETKGKKGDTKADTIFKGSRGKRLIESFK